MNGGDEVAAAAAAPPAEPPQPLEWKFSQVFGERTAGEEVQEGKLCVLVYLDPVVIIANWGLFSDFGSEMDRGSMRYLCGGLWVNEYLWFHWWGFLLCFEESVVIDI